MERTLAGIRNDLSLSQEEMAERLKVSTPTYQRYEKYKIKIPTDIIIQIADMVGIVDIREIKYK